ncbi:MAG: FAD-dependent oxidoreductase [Lachnospiraceae bacterium]|nr:FAD-dependent oxidoreductase [Lachnospiraceae bacterium]
MLRIRDIKLPVTDRTDRIMDKIADILCLDKIYPGNSYPDYSYKILRRSTDARKKPDIFFVYTVLVIIGDRDEKKIVDFFEKNGKTPAIRKKRDKILTDDIARFVIPECGDQKLKNRPVVVGAGPAGLFSALLLARRGFCPLLVERGEPVDERTKRVEEFWKNGRLSPRSNVQFGEGGAGTFSDGKLNTLTKDVSGRNTFVISTFAEHGAPQDILTDAKPHIGTDKLKDVVRNIRKEIIDLGGEVMFNTCLSGIVSEDGHLSKIVLSDLESGNVSTVDTDICILAIGHSARDTFEMLYDSGIPMSAKSFAMGFRVIHPQSIVNEWSYGVEDPERLGLAPADYKVANTSSNDIRVYSFCMCPGGYVVNASSEEGRSCVNGMSEYKRDGRFANSAIIAAVDPDDFIQSQVPKDHPLAGMYFQRNIEEEAYRRGEGALPVQYFGDFVKNEASGQVRDLTDCVKGDAKPSNLRGIYSDRIDKAIIESIKKFGYTRKDFDAYDAVMAGVETRTSSPVRIERGDDLESTVKGLYPCGEGAGYAGGIVSAAADGIKCAVAVIEKYRYDKVETEE